MKAAEVRKVQKELAADTEAKPWSVIVADRLIRLMRFWRAQDRQQYRGIRRSRYLRSGGVKR